ncbi:MAG TPA: fibronectin type III domain-containing protein, partial [Mycobacterium sp.]|nr:fibronectin type III domain-containing protein [Mycobacterium sp.]
MLAAGGCSRSDGDRFSVVEQAASAAFVQVGYATPQLPATTVNVPFSAAQSAGDLNVVVVGWKDTVALVATVTDTMGNAYQLAAGPTAFPGALTQSFYYAKNIAAATAGANVVQVAFNAAAQFPDIRILEYAGLDQTNPLDASAAAMGIGASSSSAPVTTTNASDLLVGANLVVGTSTTGPGPGFTSRVITAPDGDIAEDRVVSAVGSYSAAASLNGAAPWVMQIVAFKAMASSPPPPPTAPTNLAAAVAGTSQIDLSWTNTSTSQTGVKIERSADNVTFTQITVAGATAVSYSDSGLSASTTYFYRVRATSASGDSAYSNTDSATTQSPPAAAIAFVQTNYATPQSSVATVSVSFSAAQSAGNLNVVVVGWNDTTAQVSSVTDTKGNAYQLAVGPAAVAGAVTQSIYYAKNVVAAAAGANIVTASFTVAALYPDIRILEYGGMDSLSPVDVTASATGSTATSSTPPVVTTKASDLLFAANTVATWTTGAGTGWTNRVITSPDGDIAEDRIVSTAGS